MSKIALRHLKLIPHTMLVDFGSDDSGSLSEENPLQRADELSLEVSPISEHQREDLQRPQPTISSSPCGLHDDIDLSDSDLSHFDGEVEKLARGANYFVLDARFEVSSAPKNFSVQMRSLGEKRDRKKKH